MQFGVDPLQNYTSLQLLREREQYPCMDTLFLDVLHNDGTLFKESILFFITLNHRFVSCLP